MDLHQALKAIESCEEFKDKPEDSYLAHAFVMTDAGKEEWQLGWFSPSEDRMISFIVGDKIQRLPPAEVLKDGGKILELKREEVKISPEKALEAAAELRKEHYAVQVPIRTFYLLQCIEDGTVYNITFVTKQLNTINIRVDAGTGEVARHSCAPLVSMG